jgi:hypothetical protein
LTPDRKWELKRLVRCSIIGDETIAERKKMKEERKRYRQELRKLADAHPNQQQIDELPFLERIKKMSEKQIESSSEVNM